VELRPEGLLTGLAWSTFSLDILYVITDTDLGGVPLHLSRLAVRMRAEGFSPRIVSLAPPGPVAANMREAGIAVDSCFGRGGWDFRVLNRLTRNIQDANPRIVHSMLFHANVAARYAARRAGIPCNHIVCEIQTVEVERRWHLWVDRWTHGGCRLTIGNSPSVIEHLADHARIPRGRLRLVRGGIDPKRLHDARPADRSALGVETHAPVVLWVGRLDPIKGLAFLIDAFGAVAGSTAAHLLLAGDGPVRDRLQGQIIRSNLSDRVHLLGPRNDVASLLKAADVFVFPSRAEGLPNALLEAMAAGVPTVATDVAGCRDLIENGVTGLLVPYGDTGSLAGAIRRLLEDRALANRLAAEAARVVHRDWSLENCYRAYLDLYMEIIAGT